MGGVNVAWVGAAIAADVCNIGGKKAIDVGWRGRNQTSIGFESLGVGQCWLHAIVVSSPKITHFELRLFNLQA